MALDRTGGGQDQFAGQQQQQQLPHARGGEPQQLWGAINQLKSLQRGLMGGDSRCHGYGQQLGTIIEDLQAFAGTGEQSLVTAGGTPAEHATAPPGGPVQGRVT